MTGHWLLPALLAAATNEAELRPWLVGIALLFDDHQKVRLLACCCHLTDAISVAFGVRIDKLRGLPLLWAQDAGDTLLLAYQHGTYSKVGWHGQPEDGRAARCVDAYWDRRHAPRLVLLHVPSSN